MSEIYYTLSVMYHVIDSYYNLLSGSFKYSVLNFIVIYIGFNQKNVSTDLTLLNLIKKLKIYKTIYCQ